MWPRIVLSLSTISLLAVQTVVADGRHDGLNVNQRLDCFRESQCFKLKEYTCKPGYKYVGFDRNTCRGVSDMLFTFARCVCMGRSPKTNRSPTVEKA